jgi:peptidoglycan/xylan/chitin deacetylase (PgdA/CDA1 family)
MDTLLKIGYPLSLDAQLPALNNRNFISVTFDDGYQSVLQNALPILYEKNIPVTIFVPTGFLGKKAEWIRNPNHPYYNEIVLTEKQLEALDGHLITIGSHTVSHINLTNINERTAKREIVDSKITLERILRRKVTLFAAPYATLDENMAPLFKQAGYERVFLNIPTYPATKTDLFIMGRNSVEPSDWPIEFFLKLAGAYQWLPWAVNLKKKFTQGKISHVSESED